MLADGCLYHSLSGGCRGRSFVSLFYRAVWWDNLSAWCVVPSYASAISCRFNDLPNGIYHEVGLFDLDVVPAILRDDLP
jgi:hypothetical protein